MKLDEAAIVDRLMDRLPGVLAIYLFGSAAAGEAGPGYIAREGRVYGR